MIKKNRVNTNRLIRHFRIRKRVQGNSDRPRLSLYPSLQHLEAQIVNDFDQRTIIGFSTKGNEFKKTSGLKTGGNVAAAVFFGKYVAQKAQAKGIKKVVFDRGGFLYHGRIKAFADAAREQGLSF